MVTPPRQSDTPYALAFEIPPDLLAALKKTGGKGIKVNINGASNSLKIGDVTYSLSATQISQNVHPQQMLYESKINDKTSFEKLGRITHSGVLGRPVSSSSASSSSSLTSSAATATAALASVSSSAGPADEPSQITSRQNSRSPLRISAQTKPNRLKLDANKRLLQMSITAFPVRIIHLLALAPISAKDLAAKMKLKESDIEPLFKDYGQPLDDLDTEDTKVTLQDRFYKDLRVWEYKYSSAQRATVIKKAEKVFDKLKLPADHAARRNLIDPAIKKKQAEEREREKDALLKKNLEEEAAKRRDEEERLMAEQAQKKAAAAAARSSRTSPNGGTSVNGHASTTSNIASNSSSSTTSAATATSAGSSAGANGSKSPQQQTQHGSGSSMLQKVIGKKRTGSNDLAQSAPSAKRKPTSSSGNSSSAAAVAVASASATSSTASSTVLSDSGSSSASRRRPTVSAGSNSANAGTSSGDAAPVRRKPNPVPTASVSIPAKPNKQQVNGNGSAFNSHNKPSSTKDENLFELAQQFKQKYQIYTKLYQKVKLEQDRRGRHTNGNGDTVRRASEARTKELISMHNELSMVKKKLWEMSPKMK